MSIELFNAVRTDNLNRVGELIAAGVDPNLQYSSGYTAYMIAENYGLRPGFTALMLASDKGHLKILNFLINAGANIDLQDIKGFTALDIAIKKGTQEIIDILIRAENKVKKNIAVDAFMRSSKNDKSILLKDTPLTSLYRNFKNKYPFLIHNVFEYAYGKDEENEGAEESKSNRGDAGGRRRKSKSKTRKSGGTKKSKRKRKKSKNKRRKKSKSKRSKKSKRRKSIRK